MPYEPNPFDETQPDEGVFAGTAAAEFRALKLAMAAVVAGANYEGEWSAQVGAFPKGGWVTHNDALWLSKVAIADITTIEPTLANSATWFRFSQVSTGGYVSKTSNTGSALLPSGTELERDAVPVKGARRFNDDIDDWEGYNGTEWVPDGWLEWGVRAIASGNTVSFTGLPAWPKQMSILVQGQSGSSTGHMRMRLGNSGGLITTGYAAARQYVNMAASTAGAPVTDGFYIHNGGAGVVLNGKLDLIKYGNIWHFGGGLADSSAPGGFVNAAGVLDLASVLTQLEFFLTLGNYDNASANLRLMLHK